MGFLKAEHFASRHGGINALLKFIELASLEDNPLEAIAEEFHISVSQASRLRIGMGQRPWMPNEGTARYVRFVLDAEENRVNELRSTSNKFKHPATVLRLRSPRR